MRNDDLQPKAAVRLFCQLGSAMLLALCGGAPAWGDPKVELRLPPGDIYFGSYRDVKLRVVPANGIAKNDLELVVPDGPQAGTPSTAVEGKVTAWRLCVGSQLGPHILQAVQKSTGKVLGETKFTVTNDWKNQRLGPSVCVLDGTNTPTYQLSWGGGPSGPQNIPVEPQIGNRRLVVVLVDTSSKRIGDSAGRLEKIKADFAGELPAVNRFYEETSLGQFHLKTGDVVGPVSLDSSWEDNFSEANGFWFANESFYGKVISEADPLIDYSDNPVIVFAVESPTATQFPWPGTTDGYYDTDEGEQHVGRIQFSTSWHDVDPREIHETLSHEFGHVMGLGDQYPYENVPPQFAARAPWGWDIMDDEDPFPYFSLPHRMVVGWINPSWIKAYNFSGGVIPAPGGDTVTLAASDLSPPPAGQFSGIEIRIADGLNYYFEYRRAQPTLSADQNLPMDASVVGFDFAYKVPSPLPVYRMGLMLLPSGPSNADGAVLQPGKQYVETDPSAAADVKVKVLSSTDTSAVLNVQYGTLGVADPSIRSWPASEDREWESPDIDVRNDRNGQGDPNSSWFNTPWTGHNNKLVATVRNNGDVDATAVRVRFSAFDFNVGGTPTEYQIGEVVKDVPAGGAPVEFTTDWVPGASEHTCIKAQIALYQDTVTQKVEKTELNNVAQTNYTHFISSSASPFSRVGTSVRVNNPTKRPMRITFIPHQTNRLYHSFIEHVWVALKPGESSSIRVQSEYAGQQIQDSLGRMSDKERNLASRLLETDRLKPNRLSIAARMLNFEPKRKDLSATTLSGATLRVDQGIATRVDLNVTPAGVVTGRVRTANGASEPDSFAILSVWRSGGPGAAPRDIRVPVRQGIFRTEVRPDWKRVSAYYLGPAGVADGESLPVTRH